MHPPGDDVMSSDSVEAPASDGEVMADTTRSDVVDRAAQVGLGCGQQWRHWM